MDNMENKETQRKRTEERKRREQAKKPKKPRQKREKAERPKYAALMTIVYLMFILTASTVLSYYAIVWSNDMFAFAKDDVTYEIYLPEGIGTSDIAEILEEEGIIKYGWLFDAFISLTSDNISYLAGTHEISSQMDYRAIVDEIEASSTSTTTVTVTIPEGYTVAQIIDLLVENGVSTRAALEETEAEYPYKHDFLQDVPMGQYRLEGYLFPDTYEFYKGESTIQVFNKMLNNFNTRMDDALLTNIEESGMTMHEIITIASLIEREAQLAEEQALVSSVIYNRLNSADYPYLNIDASILYVVGHTSALTQADLAYDSPYNTYLYEGLPPGPIANPGYAAIYAAANPESTSYYYYVAKSDGSHVFTSTLDEHNAAIAAIKSEEGN